MIVPPPFFRPTYHNFKSYYGSKDTINKVPNSSSFSYCPNDFSSVEENTTKENYECNNFFNIFGFKVYFDDLLILAILFFLYKEDVEDNYLYLILIILLLS